MNVKGAFLAFTCISIAGLCHATADELLDFETRDLSEMKTVSGITVVFDPGKINMVYTLPRFSGRSSGRSGSITNIVGLSGGPQEVDETADSLLDRLNLRQYFISLTFGGRATFVKEGVTTIKDAINAIRRQNRSP